jgi:hypothetical protein
MTDEEAAERNAEIANPKKRIKSLESMCRTMNADGTKTFEQEILNEPQVEGERFFDIEKIDTRLNHLKSIEWQSLDPKKPNYRKREGDWITWGEYKKSVVHYVVGADVSEGYGNDSAVIEIFDVATGKQIKEFESNLCPPSALAKLMVKEGKLANDALLCPERNAIGVAVVDALKNENYRNIYREVTKDKTSDRPLHKFGWHTNSKTKPLMLFEFKRDFEAGLIEIMSVPLLKEMRAFTNGEVSRVGFDEDISNHFDRLMAAAITWQMRKVNQIKGFVGSI